MTTLSCIGAGRLGKTICRLLSATASIQQIVNRSLASSQRAVDFIGSGVAAPITDLQPANIWLIATPDSQIETAYKQLQASGALDQGAIVFHCSGSISAAVLNSNNSDIHVASVHPIHSFADPQKSLSHFPGCHCAIEGQPDAVEVLQTLFESIGALPFVIDSQHKALYHSATVMACNYLVSLMQASQQILTAAGVDDRNGNPLESLIRQTLDNYLDTNATSALTGPIARGDVKTVASHLDALRQETDGVLWQQVYTALGKATLPIASQQGQASISDLQQIKELLDQH
ncbi:DUF2520 domain-containing protein [Porticoccaceae bacterium]|nr:DUF2520 domain-containing protein [Porticoccaceae bacterium]